MSSADQLRNALRDLETKARELELDKKLSTFADQADQHLRRAATTVGELAHDNRGRIDDQLTRAGAAVDGKTDGRYSSYVGRVRTGVLTGVDWVADQRQPDPSPPGSTTASHGPEPSDPGDSDPTRESTTPSG